MVVMDPKLPSPQSVGREFVRQYYTLLNQAPLHLHRFYSAESSFVHGGLDANEKMSEPVYGQQDIHQRIMQLNFRECKAKISQVDAHHTIGQGVVVQVSGELSNQGLPMRRFMQTFVLAPQSAKKYYVHNDIFRYQDEVFSEDVQDDSPPPIIDQGVTQVAEISKSTPSTVDIGADSSGPNNNVVTPNYSTQPNIGEDGIPSVSINRSTPHVEQPPAANLNEVPPSRGQEEKEPRVNGGGEHHPEKQIPDAIEEPKQVNSNRDLTSPEVPSLESANDVEASAKSPQPQEAEQSGDESTKTPPATENPGAPLSYALMAKQAAGNSSASTQQGSSSAVPGNAAIPVPTGSLPPAGFGKQPAAQQYQGSASQQPRGDASKEGTPSPSGPSAFGPQKGGYNRGSGPSGRGGGGGSGINRSQGPLISGGGSQGGNRYNREDDSNRDERRRGQNTTVYPDSQQLFVGNLPHNCSEADLEALFGQYGKVAEIRINSKGVIQSKTMPSGQRVPNFGFVVFEKEQSVQQCLSNAPIHLPDGHRLNVETKKNKPMQMRTESTSVGHGGYQQSGSSGSSGGGGGERGGMGGGPLQSKGRGGVASGGIASTNAGNFGGSQEQLGGGPRSAPWSRPGGQGGRGMPRGGGRGGSYGGDRSLSSGGGRLGGNASSGGPSHGSGPGTSNRGAYAAGPRRS